MPLYFIALLPPKPLQEKIGHLKLEIAEKYAAKHALKLPAHITLQIPFRMDTVKEDKLIQILEDFSAAQKKFAVNLKDFGRFGQKVIFINVENHDPLIHLHADLQQELNKFLEFKRGEQFSKIHPHVTLATRDLHHDKFSVAWADIRERKFTDEFKANQLTLFKHTGKIWKIFKEFHFSKNENR